MKVRVFLWLLWGALLIIPAGGSVACGKKETPHQTNVIRTTCKSTCCEGRKPQVKSAKHKTEHAHDCREDGCECGQYTSTFALKVYPDILLQNPVLTILSGTSWFFTENIPAPVYLSLWMPPNLNGSGS